MMRRWKRWRIVAVGFDGKSFNAEMSRIEARDWNADPHTPRFWTRWGADRAATFFSTTLLCGMKAVHESETEDDRAA